MLRKAALALGLAPIVGAVTAAQANDHADNWNEVGGYHIGPLGQRLGGTGFWPHWRGAHISGSLMCLGTIGYGVISKSDPRPPSSGCGHRLAWCIVASAPVSGARSSGIARLRDAVLGCHRCRTHSLAAPSRWKNSAELVWGPSHTTGLPTAGY
jgi:hypothetical protein